MINYKRKGNDGKSTPDTDPKRAKDGESFAIPTGGKITPEQRAEGVLPKALTVSPLQDGRMKYAFGTGGYGEVFVLCGRGFFSFAEIR